MRSTPPRNVTCVDIPEPAVLAVTIEGAQRYTGLGRTSLYKAINDGHLAAVKAGTRTLVLMDSLRAFVASLPPARSW